MNLVNRLKLLTSPGFLLATALMGANDFLFKPLFHNWLTGKVSDFAGLFAFALFIIAVVPRFPRSMACLCGAGFVAWKSELAQPLIDWWNLSNLPPVSRVQDPTDLLALLVLPFSVAYTSRFRLRALHESQLESRHRVFGMAATAMAVVLFTATSRSGRHVCCSRSYEFSMAKSEFLDRLLQAGARNISRMSSVSTEIVDGYSFDLRDTDCGGDMNAYVHVKQENGRTTVNVRYISYDCRTRDDARIQKQFEEQIVKAIERASKE